MTAPGPVRILSLQVRDIRFPTSLSLDGSEGHGLTFTCGRGTEVVVAAVRALEHLLPGGRAWR